IRTESGEPIDVALPAKSLALLAFLAVEAGPHTREELMALLWGESPEEKASGSLRQALSTLPATVDSQLPIDPSTVEVDPSVRCDVRWFRETAAREPEAALGIDVSRFLAGLSLRNCPGFEEWLDTTRRSLTGRYCQLLADQARKAAAQRDWRRVAE